MEKFLTIGEISKIFKTTTRQLRFYEEINLLKPAKVDESNGYRYYSEENCNQLKKILCLKDLGLSLCDITSYLSSNKEAKRKILSKYLRVGKHIQYIINHIFKDNDYNLNFVNDISYVGNDVKKKNVTTLKGVWLLDGVFKSVKDAQKNENRINKETPYKFLAFDEVGNSPWFYFADDQFVIFNTWYKPSKEIYQIINDKVYLKINNPNEHIFGKIENPIEEKHILVFKKISETYDDYVNFVKKDEFVETFEYDSKLVGVWKLNSQSRMKYLIVNANGTADVCLKNGIKKYEWSKGCFYDEDLKVKLNYEIKNNKLTLENKDMIYTFSNIKGVVEEFVKM